MNKIFFALLIVFISCAQEDEMIQLISFEGSTYNYINSDCDNSDPELNECSGFIFFQSKNDASGLLDGGDIVSEYSYNLKDKTLFLISANKGDSEEFEIVSENTLIRKSDKTTWERSGIVLDGE